MAKERQSKRKRVVNSSSDNVSLDGRMSTFGGPEDVGVAPAEGLALVSQQNMDDFTDVLLPKQPPETTGLARRLDPETFYIACRWNYAATPHRYLRSIRVKVTNPKSGKSEMARPVDWGPAMWTGRVADLSPGLADSLELTTDDRCIVDIPLPKMKTTVTQSTDAPVMIGRVLDVRPDTIDFRDQMYIPTLTEVPAEITLEEFMRTSNPVILNQGQEGACTGFGLAAVANYLLVRRRIYPDRTPVSARMLYEMARRYDEWDGEDYSGSSARGAVKGWHKHGVCSDEVWPYSYGERGEFLNTDRSTDAKQRPLGAYFRVNHKDIVAMHAAISEVGILYATARVHMGWSTVKSDGKIRFSEENTGGHAFAIVGYDRDGYWIQNSWGEGWGRRGFAHISYDDWLRNGSDVWATRLGAAVNVNLSEAVLSASPLGAGDSQIEFANELRPHLIMVGNEGVPLEKGRFANSPDQIKEILLKSFPEITKGWETKRILLYAHGGLVNAEGAIQRVADYRKKLLENEVFPLAFIWHTDFWSTIKNILSDSVSKRKDEGVLSGLTDFLLDRLDDSLEPIARAASGYALWSEIKENAVLATANKHGAARLVLGHLKTLIKENPDLEIHVVGHSAGSIFMGPILNALTSSGRVDFGVGSTITGMGEVVKSCSLWAPACTTKFFKKHYMAAMSGGAARRLREFALYTLTDNVEKDDHCAKIYHKSLLYLVSNAFEEKPRIPLFRDGEPILGMDKFVQSDKEIKDLLRKEYATHVMSPAGTSDDPLRHSQSTSHGGFDDDEPTLKGLLARVLDGEEESGAKDSAFSFEYSASRLADQRGSLNKIK